MSSREDPRTRNMSDSSYAIHRATALNRSINARVNSNSPDNDPDNNNGAGDPMGKSSQNSFYHALRTIAPDAKVVDASATLAQRRLCEVTNFVNRQARIENIQAEFARHASEYSHWARGVALPLLDSRDSFPRRRFVGGGGGEKEDDGAHHDGSSVSSAAAVEAYGAKLAREGNDVCAQSDRAVAAMRAAAKRLEVC